MDFGIVSDIGHAVVDKAGDAIDGAEEFASDVGHVIEGGAEAIEHASEWAADEAEDAAQGLADAAGWLASESGDLWQAAVAEGGDIASSLENFAEARWQDASHFVDDLGDTLADAAQAAWDTASKTAEQAWEQIASAADAAWAGLGAAVDAALEALTAVTDLALATLEAATLWVVNVAASLVEDALQVLASLVEWVWELAQGLVQFLIAIGACLGGEVVYSLSKADNILLNALRPYLPIPNDVQERLRVALGNDTFFDVFVLDNASLSANTFKSGTDGMTFGMDVTPIGIPGYAIYLKPRFDFSDPIFKGLLVHELIHVRQYRRLGGPLAFACAYGVGYAQGGYDYASNPMEQEAYSFVSDHQSVVDAL